MESDSLEKHLPLVQMISLLLTLAVLRFVHPCVVEMR